MSAITAENVRRILADLIALPTVNPMGRPYQGRGTVEHPVVEYILELFRPYGTEMRRLPCSSIHESLLVLIPGRTQGPFTLLESHIDTVPADDWLQEAFTPRLDGEVIFGCGACDDKGSLAAMLLAAREVVENGEQPPFPLAFLAAGDEEYAQTGIKSFVNMGYPIRRAVFGEPTSLQPILQHKGTVRWDITVHGRSAHTSRPELGRDAIAGAVQVMVFLHDHQRELQGRYVNPLMTGPTITVTMIHGGHTCNAVADQCTMAVDFRVLPGMDPQIARRGLIEELAALGQEVTHSDVQLVTPALSTQPDHPFSRAVLDICRRVTNRSDLSFGGAPYGTDASWVADQAPAIVLGPGSVEHAHAADEHVDLREVLRCAHIYHDILMCEC